MNRLFAAIQVPLYTARLVNVNQLVRAEVGQIVEVKVSEVRVSFLCGTTHGFLGPAYRCQSPADAESCD